jgi:hypothetical protein
MRRGSGVASVVLLLAAAILAPLPSRPDLAARSPREAAALAEAAIPPIGLVWGKLRGWERAGDGWRLVWQPSHGAWLLRAWVGDGASGPLGWWLDAAPWLPGARLSRAAAVAAVGGGEGDPVPRERLARRDWLVGEERLLGALPAGHEVTTAGTESGIFWGAVLAALVFAGAISRVLTPVVVAPGWRRVVGWTVAATIATLPLMTPLAARRFEVGVRPWVSELVFGATAAMALVAVSLAAVRYPCGRGRAAGAVLAAALAAGLLAGRAEPVPWCAAVAGLGTRAVAWLAVILLGGWLAALAGEGLRQLLAPAGRASRALLAVLGVAMVLAAGPWLGASLAILGAAAGGRGQGTPVSGLTLWGWMVGATWATCAWPGPLRDSLMLLLAGVALVTAATVADQRHGV